MNLELKATKIQFIYDDGDTNAINFTLDDNGYFSIQNGVYLEEDDDLNQPIFEYKDQGHSQSGGIEGIVFGKRIILLNFKNSDLFLEKYKTTELLLNQSVDRKTVDFFANHLFLGDYIQYDKNFEDSNKVAQTKYREPLS